MTSQFNPIYENDWQGLNILMESLFYELKALKKANGAIQKKIDNQIEDAAEVVIGVVDEEHGVDMYSPTEGEPADIRVPPTGKVHDTLAGQAIPSSYFLDLRGTRPTTTTWNITADWLCVHDSSTPWKTIALANVNETNDITLAGPIAGGRDQSGAFTASSWVYFFIIYDPITGNIGSLSSSSSTSPSLPTGYSYFVRCSSAYFVAGILRSGRQVSERIWLDTFTAITMSGKTDYTEIDLSAVIPPTAKSVQGGIGPTEAVAENRTILVASDEGVCEMGQRFHSVGAAAVRYMYYDLPISVSQTLTVNMGSDAETWNLFIYSYQDDL